MPSADPYQQIRRLEFSSGLQAVAEGGGNDLDMDISVRTAEETLKFELGIWNLDDESWSAIKKQDTVDIYLGWQESGVERVCFGEIVDTRMEPDGADTRYVVTGSDATMSLFSVRISRTYEDMDPGAIARELAGECGASIGLIETVGEPIEGKYPIKDDRPVRHWLRQLIAEAGQRSEEQWQWSARRGELYFHPKSTTIDSSVSLVSNQNSGYLQSASYSTGKSTQDGSEEIDFDAYLKPQVRMGGIVSLDARVASGEFRVSECEFVSDTESGDHRVSGTLVPTGASYSASYPGDLSMNDKLRLKEDQIRSTGDQYA